jgi:hypothetical protein
MTFQSLSSADAPDQPILQICDKIQFDTDSDINWPTLPIQKAMSNAYPGGAAFSAR